MAKKPVMMGNEKVVCDGELRRFKTTCRACGTEFILTIPQKKKFTGQVGWDHGCAEGQGKRKFYTVNPDHPETIHKNHPIDSEGTMYEIV